MEESYVKAAMDIIMSHMETEDLKYLIEIEKEIRKYKSKINKRKRKLAKIGKLEQECPNKNGSKIENIKEFCKYYHEWYRNNNNNDLNMRMICIILRWYEIELQYWEDCLIKTLQEQSEKEVGELE